MASAVGSTGKILQPPQEEALLMSLKTHGTESEKEYLLLSEKVQNFACGVIPQLSYLEFQNIYQASTYCIDVRIRLILLDHLFLQVEENYKYDQMIGYLFLIVFCLKTKNINPENKKIALHVFATRLDKDIFQGSDNYKNLGEMIKTCDPAGFDDDQAEEIQGMIF